MKALFIFLLCTWLFLNANKSGGMMIRFPSNTCNSDEKCIEVRKCPFFDDLLNKTSNPPSRNVIQFIRGNQCGLFRNVPYVCCFQQKTTPAPEVHHENKEKTLVVHEELREKDKAHKNVYLLRNDICGTPLSTTSRIISGKKTAIGEFPWMALIAYNVGGKIEFRCAGTVISEIYIMTAAHCILNSTIVGVRLGEHNLNNNEDCDLEENYCAPPPQDFYIKAITVHNEYDPKTFNNDIALIKLDVPANFSTPTVKPICLPYEKVDLLGKFLVVSGWGVTEYGRKSSELLQVSVPVVPMSECQKIYNKFVPLNSRQICAGGYKGQDSCAGDSGGPLKYIGFVNDTLRFIQYGIVSFGPKPCGISGQPAIYTNVYEFMDWILEKIGSN